jgi:hypothetical protein
LITRRKGNRCRSRKTKCDGVRPICSSCAGHNHDCHYVAEADATPIIAQKRRNEALQQQCNEQQALLQSLVSVTEGDALALLSRLREGETAESIVSIASNMQRHHRQPRLHESLLPPASFPSPATVATASDTRRPLSPMSFEPYTASPMVFEPKVDVVPLPPTFNPRWYV